MMCPFSLFFSHLSFPPNSISDFQNLRITYTCCLFFEMSFPRGIGRYYEFLSTCLTASLVWSSVRSRRDVVDLYTKFAILEAQNELALSKLGIHVEKKKIGKPWKSIETFISLERDLIQYIFCTLLLFEIRRDYVQPWNSIETVIGPKRDLIQYFLFASAIWNTSGLFWHNSAVMLSFLDVDAYQGRWKNK